MTQQAAITRSAGGRDALDLTGLRRLRNGEARAVLSSSHTFGDASLVMLDQSHRETLTG